MPGVGHRAKRRRVGFENHAGARAWLSTVHHARRAVKQHRGVPYACLGDGTWVTSCLLRWALGGCATWASLQCAGHSPRIVSGLTCALRCGAMERGRGCIRGASRPPRAAGPVGCAPRDTSACVAHRARARRTLDLCQTLTCVRAPSFCGGSGEAGRQRGQAARERGGGRWETCCRRHTASMHARCRRRGRGASARSAQRRARRRGGQQRLRRAARRPRRTWRDSALGVRASSDMA